MRRGCWCVSGAKCNLCRCRTPGWRVVGALLPPLVGCCKVSSMRVAMSWAVAPASSVCSGRLLRVCHCWRCCRVSGLPRGVLGRRLACAGLALPGSWWRGVQNPMYPHFPKGTPICTPTYPRIPAHFGARLRTSQSHFPERKRKRPEACGSYRPCLWCPGPDSNRHALRRGILSPLRLPISPPGRGSVQS